MIIVKFAHHFRMVVEHFQGIQSGSILRKLLLPHPVTALPVSRECAFPHTFSNLTKSCACDFGHISLLF